MLATYSRLNASHPIATKSAISGALLGAADVAAQQCKQGAGEPQHDWRRTAAMAAWGLGCNGPAGHAFYAALDRFVTRQGMRATALKIAIDQLLYTPPLTAGFFLFQTLAAGGSTAAALATVRAETGPTLLYNWGFWSLAHVITFTAIPLEHRVAWVALKNFTWSTFLSWRLSVSASRMKPSAADGGCV